MPELPDVEVFRRHVAATSLHQRIKRTSVSDDRVLEEITNQSLAKQLKMRQFSATHRHGKYLLLATDGPFLVLHFGMTGTVRFVKESEEPPEYSRAEFNFADGGCLAYTSKRLLGRIFLVQDVDELIAKKQLGPDALDIGRKQFRERIGEKKGAIKAALMDQSVVCGIGNVYSDEILFHASMHPETDVQRLDSNDFKSLYDTSQRVLKTTIRCHANPDEMPSDYLLPHRRGDGRCPRCNTKLKKRKVGGRSAVFCQGCQKQSR